MSDESNEDDDFSKNFDFDSNCDIEKNFLIKEWHIEAFKRYLSLPSSDFFSNSDDTYCNNNQDNISKMIIVKLKSSNSQKQSENSLNSSSNSISNKSKQNLNIINNKIIETKNNNKEDTINIDEKKENKINVNHERKGKQSVKLGVENDKTNDKTNEQTNDQANDKTNDQTNSNSVPKNGNIFNTFQKKTHDKNATDNEIKKGNTFFNKFLIVHSNKIIKKYQESKQSPESNSLKKKKKINYDEFVQISVSITSDTGVEFNQNLQFKTLKEILSFPISNKIKKYNEDHNKQITEKYYKECPTFKEFCDLYYGDIRNLINDEDNSFEELFDTYKEELGKRQDKEDIENIIKNFTELVKNRKKRKISP